MKNTIYLLFAVLLICAGCPEDTDPADSEITLINNSCCDDITHYFELKEPTDTSLATIAYPQTPENTIFKTLDRKDTVRLREGFKRILNDNPDKILMLYLFSRDTIEKVSWDRIVDEYLILRRYDLTLEDLEAMDWTVEYK